MYSIRMDNGVHCIDGQNVPICIMFAVFFIFYGEHPFLLAVCRPQKDGSAMCQEVRMLTRPMPHSVLIVSASERDTESIRGLLLESGFARTSVASDAATARERYGAEQHEIVIISSPVQGESGVRLACDITQMGYAGVLLLAKSEQYEEFSRRVERYGVMLLQKPLSRALFLQTLRLLAAMRERMRSVEDRARTLETRMNELKIIDRAKWVLVEYLKMSEAEAHRYIEKQAMDRRTTRGEIAEGILKTYEN